MGLLDFFATGQGVLALGLLAALIVLLWDWRVALIALVLIQIGVATLLVQVEGASSQIMFVQTLIVALCAVMIAIAGVQVQLRRSGRQSGGWFFRLLVLALLGVALYSLDLSVVLPEVAPAITRIFGWIALIALIMLSLGDNPVFTITALIIWCVLGQAMAALYAPASEIMVALGLMELVLGLTASYLLLAERLPRQLAGVPNGNGVASTPRRPVVGQTGAPAAQNVRTQSPLTATRPRATEYDLSPVTPPKGSSQPAPKPSAEGNGETNRTDEGGRA